MLLAGLFASGGWPARCSPIVKPRMRENGSTRRPPSPRNSSLPTVCRRHTAATTYPDHLVNGDFEYLSSRMLSHETSPLRDPNDFTFIDPRKRATARLPRQYRFVEVDEHPRLQQIEVRVDIQPAPERELPAPTGGSGRTPARQGRQHVRGARGQPIRDGHLPEDSHHARRRIHGPTESRQPIRCHGHGQAAGAHRPPPRAANGRWR